MNQMELSAQLGDALRTRGWRVATAESCTGGGVASALTTVAGSSAWFGYGFVTYANEAKERMLGVSAATLMQHGAVSEAVVREMVAGALQRSGAELAVAVSGIAGPEGGTADKPVGTVWFCWGSPSEVRARCHLFSGDRESVREQAVVTALQGLLALSAV